MTQGDGGVGRIQQQDRGGQARDLIGRRHRPHDRRRALPGEVECLVAGGGLGGLGSLRALLALRAAGACGCRGQLSAQDVGQAVQQRLLGLSGAAAQQVDVEQHGAVAGVVAHCAVVQFLAPHEPNGGAPAEVAGEDGLASGLCGLGVQRCAVELPEPLHEACGIAHEGGEPMGHGLEAVFEQGVVLCGSVRCGEGGLLQRWRG